MEFTFAQHMALAQVWVRYNGKRGTEKQALKLMHYISAQALVVMLQKRNIPIPIGVSRSPVHPYAETFAQMDARIATECRLGDD